ncbi:MAG TPA: hypothetical protein VNJ05_08125, partial [Sphingomicrobium sp.]|nr:hypothetical protein [Sphingomicrobium sp.]
AKSPEGAGFAKAQAETLATTIAEASNSAREDLVTKDYLKAERASTKNDLVRWLIASQIVLVALLAALANFTKVFG